MDINGYFIEGVVKYFLDTDFTDFHRSKKIASRVGREDPPPRQTGHADLPHPAFLKAVASGIGDAGLLFVVNSR
jgi:hypothetical protein